LLKIQEPLKSPYPYFGGKRLVAPIIWKVFGDVSELLRTLLWQRVQFYSLGKDWEGKIETINELNPYIANFWRAIRQDPEQTAYHSDWPVNEADLHARHLWLVNQGDFRESMLTDPDYFDPKVAGWWVWGLSQWIGHGWCSFEHMTVDGKPWKRGLALSSAGQGINTVSNRLPYLHRANKKLNPDPDYEFGKRLPKMKGTGGVHRQSLNDDNNQPTRKLPKFPPGGEPRQGLADAPTTNQPSRQAPRLSTSGQGINKVTRQLPFVGNAGRGVASPSRREALYQYFDDLA
jgi:hypothetical protein